MRTRSPRQGLALAAAAALAGLVGCAPTTVSPMVMRLGPGPSSGSSVHGGIRSGPRLSAPVAARTGSDNSGVPFGGDQASFSTRQWSMAYDFAVTRHFNEKLSMHLGVNGEIYYPLPLPGYGVYGGLSTWYGTEQLGIAPAVVVRGATDFGIETRGGPGSILGAEASSALYFCPEPRVALGLVPFFGVHQVFNEAESNTALYYGGALVFQIPLGKVDKIEFSGGFGRANVLSEASWNVPIVGARWGR
ncbi:hypothetical protein [Hyalangium rubrum]|uniref:Lipoprotein n=1 Tax=Hyalangium rubrum TaxID=3103134 RepID=A0ABU5H4A5_9BACT|nr:hypothetical protein [Hyalangium sp. s54d21]MDY7228302.1 hypothetical protein [Hyalangium sp. s54d21]